jgi:hypothetical protein
VEHDGGALPGDTVLPVVVGGVHGGAAEHAGDGAGGIGAIIGDATPGRRGADVTGVVVGQEGLNAHKLLQHPHTQKRYIRMQEQLHSAHDLCSSRDRMQQERDAPGMLRFPRPTHSTRRLAPGTRVLRPCAHASEARASEAPASAGALQTGRRNLKTGLYSTG